MLLPQILPKLSHVGKRQCFALPQSCQMSIFQGKKEKMKLKKEILARKKRYWDADPSEAELLPTFVFAGEKSMNRIYTWGMACFGALGVPEYCRPDRHRKKLQTMHRPARCSFIERQPVVDIACGYGFTVFAIKGQHQLMGCGINRDGQIGYHDPRKGHPLEILIRPQHITLPDKSARVTGVAAGRAHTLVKSEKGQIFSLGNNAYGQCGRAIIENEDYLHNQVIYEIKGPWVNNEMEKPKDIVCGQDHSHVVTVSGKVFSFGWGADGQTGLGHYNSVSEPTQSLGDISSEKIIKVTCSADCVLALNDKGEVFGWGNSEYGQFLTTTQEQQLSTPIKLNFRGIGTVIDIACGGTICMILDENHDVYVWGFGILGKGPNLDHSNVPVKIPRTLFGFNEFSPDVYVTKIFSGVHTNAAINSQGEVYVWGKNKGRCLGLGNCHDQYFPLKMNLVDSVSKLSLGVDHAAAICNSWTSNKQL